MEMARILDDPNAITKATTNWEFYVPRIIKQAMFEKGANIDKITKEIGTVRYRP